jgi:hypothetical protein
MTVKMLLLPAVALLALTLTACDPGSAGDTGGTTPEASGGDTACVTGLWDADVNDLAAQVARLLSDKGLPITGSSASGQQQLSLDEQGYAGMASTGLTFVITAELGDGLVETIRQTHDGSFRGDWGWDSSTVMGFANVTDEGYTVTTVVDINGQTSDAPVDIPLGGMSDVPLTVTCDGDTMTTKAQGSPFTTTWHRVGD